MVTVLHVALANLTGCVLHHILLQEIGSALYAFLHEEPSKELDLGGALLPQTKAWKSHGSAPVTAMVSL